MRLRRCAAALYGSLVGIYQHGALGFAKGAAYSSLLAFFPVLTTTTTLLIQANAEAVSRRIASFLYQVAPPGVEELIEKAIVERGARPAALPIFASLLAMWAASGVTISLMEGFQAAYRKPGRRGVVKQRLLAMWLVLVSILPVVLASALMIFGDRAETWILQRLGVIEAGQTLVGGVEIAAIGLRYAVAFASIVTVTGMMYWFGPDVGRRRRLIWPGAVLATVLWLSITQGFAWYVHNIARYNLLYGSIGAAIALMVWVYLLSLSAMVGCEFNARLDEGRRE